MPIITLAALKGGAGKTTTAMGLAAAALDRGHAARIIDIDPQGGAADWARLAFAAGDVTPDVITSRTIPDDQPSAWTIVDTPPASTLSKPLRLALTIADLIIVPMGPTAADIVRISPTIALAHEHSSAAVVVLLTRVRARTRSASEVREVLTDAGHTVLGSQVPLREAIAQALGAAPGPDLIGAHVPVFDEIATLIGVSP